VESLADLIRVARGQPGKLNWAATPGLPYYVVLALEQSAGIEMVPVGYRDFAPALQDLATGRVCMSPQRGCRHSFPTIKPAPQSSCL